MKLLLFLLLTAAPALAQTEQWPARAFGSQAVRLEPLAAWWAEAAAISAANKARPKAKQQPLPPRPMPAWVRITIKAGRDLPDAQSTSWNIQAEISEIPGQPRVEAIYLRHAPAKRRQHFYDLLDNIAAAERRQGSAAARADALASGALTYSERASIYGGLQTRSGNAAAQRSDNLASQGRTGAGRETGNAVRAMQDAAQLRKEAASLSDSPHEFVLETFALRTAEVHKLRTVYDLGLIIGF